MVEAQGKSLNEGNILLVNGFSSISLGGHEVLSLFSQGGGKPSRQGGTEVDHDAADSSDPDSAGGQPTLLQAHFCNEGISWLFLKNETRIINFFT